MFTKINIIRLFPVFSWYVPSVLWILKKLNSYYNFLFHFLRKTDFDAINLEIICHLAILDIGVIKFKRYADKILSIILLYNTC